MNVSIAEIKNYTRIATGVALLSEDKKKVLLVTSLKFPGLWVLPKGGLEINLTHEENAQKEMREEAGMAVTLYESVYDEVLQYEATDTQPAKIQREVYFRASFVSNVPWEEFQLRRREWFEINEELAKQMAPHQYQAVLRAQIAGVVADEAEALAEDEDHADA